MDTKTEKPLKFQHLKELKNSEMNKLKSLRVKLTYATFIVWVCFLAFLSYISDRMVGMFVVTNGNVQIAILDKLMNVFSGVTFILFLFVTVYVLGKSNISLKLGIFEFNMNGTLDDTKPVAIAPSNQGQ